jgi:hypothetical protein
LLHPRAGGKLSFQYTLPLPVHKFKCNSIEKKIDKFKCNALIYTQAIPEAMSSNNIGVVVSLLVPCVLLPYRFMSFERFGVLSFFFRKNAAVRKHVSDRIEAKDDSNLVAGP